MKLMVYKNKFNVYQTLKHDKHILIDKITELTIAKSMIEKELMMLTREMEYKLREPVTYLTNTKGK